VKALNDFMRAQIQMKRTRPDDDIISDMIRATLVEDGDPRPLDDMELLSIFGQVFVAGQETTAHSLTAGLYYLLTNPDQMAKVRGEPELIPNFVEETLRYLTPVNNMFRRVVKDTSLSGVELKAGDMIMLKYGSGNHDDRHFPDPERFDVPRPNARAELARKELSSAFRILLARLKNIRLARDAGPIRYTPNHPLRGVAELRIEFEAA
jgi:cytochrome P450